MTYDVSSVNRPNILFVMVDQMRFQPLYKDDPLEPLYRILRFENGITPDNPYVDKFPGFMQLRKNGIAMADHNIAASACVPSRATIMTGQYSARTGVTQTEGMFKVDTDPTFPWLPQDRSPTMGDWFRAGGYETYYFGRWDLSNPPTGSLEPWGFSQWEYSNPSSQRFGLPNLGVYRDIGYVDLVRTFLTRKGMGQEANMINSNNPTNATFKQKPWLAVASFVNPHDIGAYPFPWKPFIDGSYEGPGPLRPYGAPRQGTLSEPPSYSGYKATYRVPLNPLGFNIKDVKVPESWRAKLRDKPSCQRDYAYKFQLALTSMRGNLAQQLTPYPFQLQENAEEWYNTYLEFYLYLQYLVNLEIDQILQALYKSGQAENTIVVFTADHGELAGVHGGMIEKWHNAYRETLHVPAVISSPLLRKSDPIEGLEDKQVHHVEQIDVTSSHVDWIPTLLGLAGFDAQDRKQMAKFIQGHDVKPLPGSDLSGVIRGESENTAREGVLFVTDDTITAPLDLSYLPVSFQNYMKKTAQLYNKDGEPTADKPLLAPGPVVTPNRVQCFYAKPWKLARYWEANQPQKTQWELYNQDVDPEELHNLLSWNTDTGAPQLRAKVIQALGLTVEDVEVKLKQLRRQLNGALIRAGYGEDSIDNIGLIGGSSGTTEICDS
jgi:arylsulfatase A-like enzyme